MLNMLRIDSAEGELSNGGHIVEFDYLDSIVGNLSVNSRTDWAEPGGI